MLGLPRARRKYTQFPGFVKPFEQLFEGSYCENPGGLCKSYKKAPFRPVSLDVLVHQRFPEFWPIPANLDYFFRSTFRLITMSFLLSKLETVRVADFRPSFSA